MSGPWDDYAAAPAAPATPDIAGMITAEAQRQGVDPKYPLGAWRAEGSGDMSATSPKGARGPFQLMPGTARDLGVDPEDLAQNIQGGVTYLKRQLDTFKDPRLAFAAYNAGPGAVMAHGNVVPPYPETQAYVQRAMAPSDASSATDSAPWEDYAGAPADAAAAPTAAAPPALLPAATVPQPTIKTVGGKPVFGDTLQAVPEHQAKTIRTLVQGGIIDGSGEPGSVGSPFVQRRPEDKFKPGQFYIDARTGQLTQTPGGAAGPESDPGFLGGLGAGLGDIPNSLFKLMPNHQDSEFANAAEAHRLVYDATHKGDLGAGVGRFAGQVVGSIPLLAGGEGALGGLATKAPEAMAPAIEFLAGRGGTGAVSKGASLFARGAQEGAGAALLTSGASDQPLGEQLAEGALAGGVVRNALPVAGKAFRGMFGRGLVGAEPAAADAISPLTDDQVKAARYIQGKLPSSVTADTLRAADQSQTAAEAVGKPLLNTLASFARQDGDTADTMAEAFQARREDRGNQVLQAFSDAAGISPDATRGAVDKMVERGRTEAEPLYAAAFDDRPIWSPTLQKIAQRPSVRQALKGARGLMGEEDKDPNTLGMSFVEDPEQWASYSPPAAEAEAAPVGFAGGARGPARPPSQGPSLLKFIADNGGMADEGGEISAMGGDRWHVGKPFQRQLSGVLSPDDVAQKAFEAGYFPRLDEAPPVNHLYDAMSDEMRGRALYARQADPGALDRFNRVNAAEERTYRGGDPMDVPSPEQYVGRPEPVTEPAHQMEPKTQTWDYIKRALDDQLKPYLSGKLEWTDEARLANQTRAQLVEEVQGLNPQYKTALDASGDYLSARQAFRDGHDMIFNGRVDETDFANRLKDMTAAQRRYFRAGIANKAYESVSNAAVQPTRLLSSARTPLAQRKFQMAMGPKKAGDLQAEILKQARQKATEDRYGPHANSITADLTKEISDQNTPSAAADLLGGVVRNMHRGPLRGTIAGVGQFLAGMAAKPIQKLNDVRMPQLARDEGGQMALGRPAELADVLDALQNSGTGRGAVRKRVARGLIGGSYVPAAVGATRNTVDAARGR